MSQNVWELKDCQMAANESVNTSCQIEWTPLYNRVTMPVQSRCSYIRQLKSVKLHSSYTIQALTLIHHLQTVTSYVTPTECLQWWRCQPLAFLQQWLYLHVCMEEFQPSILFTTALHSTLTPLIPIPSCPLGPLGPSKPRSPCEDR